jgi:DNA-binding transcriptional LysR family regulator
MTGLDWDDIRFFLTVVRAGTLASAARSLAVDQTTVGRRLASLEDIVGQTLFDRTPRGLVATAAGQRVIAAAETMADAAGDFEVAARSDDVRAIETIRVATTDSLAEHYLIPAILTLRTTAPNVDVAVVTGWVCVNLLRGEADVAVRLVRPNHPRLVARKVADFALRAYASPRYIAARGAPIADFRNHELVAYSEANVSPLTVAGIDASDARIVLRTNNGNAIRRAGRDGVGIVELPSFVGDHDRELVRVCPEHERRYSVYIVTHEDRRRARSVRAVCDAITVAFKSI